MKKLLFAMPDERFDRIFPAPIVDELSSRYEIVNPDIPSVVDEAYVRERIADVDVVVTSWKSPPLSESIMNNAGRLAFVAHAAGSLKPVVTDAFWERNIPITSASQAIADGVAEFCLGLTITCSKRAFWYAMQVRDGFWPKGNDVFGPPFEIYRQNVGIIGAGYVGRKFISLLKPFGCQILLYDPFVSLGDATELGVRKVDTLDELFAESRVVSLHAPTTDDTKGMIRGDHFAQLQTGSLFINTARGVIINQQEMVQELRKGRFIACLDVTDPEPPELDDALRRLPNVLLTPHEAGSIVENLRRIGEFSLHEIDAFFASQPLKGQVTRKQLERMA